LTSGSSSWDAAKDYVMAMLNNDTWRAFGNMIEILDYGSWTRTRSRQRAIG
jgi:hypothetical protein